ncbi:hypothetical protein [Nibricoccus sp. IMCC34717]|uniref:hypothetical protein n=1 Tax=Nibricoccus sp. IMCC34717 TaxID=3034021 RepID=UPI00384EB29E
MADTPENAVSYRAVLAWVFLALVALAVAMALPVNLRSVTLPLLREAGRGTPTLLEVGRERLELEKLGVAEMVLSGAERAGVGGRGVLEQRIQKVAERRPDWVAWGGWDPFLDPVFNLRENQGRKRSTPVLEFLVTEKSRLALRQYLANSRSLGVQDLLKVRDLEVAVSFVPVGRAGGQALDSVVLLTALLYQADGMSSALQREVRGLVEEALEQKRLGPLEPFFLDLVSLGRRLNWVQVAELLRMTRSVASVAEIAQLARAVPDDLALIYSAAVALHSTDQVATFLMARGRAGLEDLRLAAGLGTGALRVLVRAGLPVNRAVGVEMGVGAEFALLHPRLALAVRYGGFFVSAYGVLRAMEALLLAGAVGWLRVRAGLLALVLGGLLIAASEPFLFGKLPLSEFRVKLSLPVLGSVAEPGAGAGKITTMDTKTLLSIALFAALQVAMYLVCLRKIREIDRQPISAGVKLRLMKNEDNLFDGGLYIGIAGTATALVLQVLGVIEANLLAAYSSNLFGIVCVALVKIRSVRPYTHRLILESKDEEDLALAERREE